MVVGKRVVAIGVVLVIAVVGATIAIVLSTKSSPTDAKEDQDGRPPMKSGDGEPHPSIKKKKHLSTFKSDLDGSSSARDSEKTIETDPLKETYAVTALAIGDWGRTIAKEGGSCCKRRKSYSVLDYNAMEYTASLLGIAAQETAPKPSVIIGHGDNFYWTGLQSATDQAYRFQETFETKYADASLQDIPWVNVMGNHDYGGASFCAPAATSPRNAARLTRCSRV